jgi:hypothetical protein
MNAMAAAAGRRLARRPPWPWIAVTGGIAGLLLAMAVTLASVKGFSIGFLLRDPNAIARQPFYYGMLQYAGSVALAATGGIALFSGAVLGKLRPEGSGAAFLALGGLLSLLLAADDLFQLHENMWRIGLGETEVFAVYGALAIALVVCNPLTVIQTPLSLGLISGFFFAASVVIDSPALGIDKRLPVGTEDCLELFGIGFWSAYFVKCSRDGILRAQDTASRRSGSRPWDVTG